MYSGVQVQEQVQVQEVQVQEVLHFTPTHHHRLPTVKDFAGGAFERCPNLITIEFSHEVEQFVNEVWWNREVSEDLLRTYSFLVQCNIIERLGTLKMMSWKRKIHSMLQRLPKELIDDGIKGRLFNDAYKKGNIYFDSIISRLSNYELAQELAPCLEMIVWQTKIMERSNYNIIDDETKRSCRIVSYAMFAIISPNVIAFLEEE